MWLVFAGAGAAELANHVRISYDDVLLVVPQSILSFLILDRFKRVRYNSWENKEKENCNLNNLAKVIVKNIIFYKKKKQPEQVWQIETQPDVPHLPELLKMHL